METSITSQFVILSIHPDKGRIIINNTFYRYGLAGSILMDFLNRGEISLENKKVSTSFRRNGETLHDYFADMMENPGRTKRVSYWVWRLSGKSRRIFSETINSLISAGILRHEKRYFLKIIPYNRYFFTDSRFRYEITETLRNILLHDKVPARENIMLIGLLKATRSGSILAKKSEEKRPLRKNIEKLSRNDEISSETDHSIREIQAAIITAVTITAAASSHHAGH